MKTKIKKCLCLVFVVAIIISCVACGNKQEKDPQDTRLPAQIGEVGFVATAYIIDNWRLDFEDGSREYTYSFLLYSDDYCAHPDENSVMYYEGATKMQFNKKFPNANINIVNLNDVTNGKTRVIVVLKTDRIIDTQKVSFAVFGSKSHINDSCTKEDYLSAGGKADEWCELTCFISTRTPKYDEFMNDVKFNNRAFTRLLDGDNTMLCYVKTDNLIKENDKVMREFDFIGVSKEANMNTFVEMMANNLTATHFTNNNPEKVELDSNVVPHCEVIDNKLYFGFKTVDGTDIQPYLKDLPAYIVYNYEQMLVFHIAAN